MRTKYMARLERRPGMFRVQWLKRHVRLSIRPLRDLRGSEPRHLKGTSQ
jgi:hypothetical protein